MIPYHGGPFTSSALAANFWRGRHAMVSFVRPEQTEIAASVAESFALDNGAYHHWAKGNTPNWDQYYEWVEKWKRHPGFDWALIPDVIDGDEKANDELIFKYWPYGVCGVPIWHLHESFERLDLLSREWPRVALGSSGQWPTPGTSGWWSRMSHVMEVVCDSQGRPTRKLHGLRMLNPYLLKHLPFASADSSNVARHVADDGRWKGNSYSPRSREVRAMVLADAMNGPVAETWKRTHIQDQLREMFSA